MPCFSGSSNLFHFEELRTSAFIRAKPIEKTGFNPNHKKNEPHGFLATVASDAKEIWGDLEKGGKKVANKAKNIEKKVITGAKNVVEKVKKDVKTGVKDVEEGAKEVAKKVEEGAKEVKSALMTFSPETPNTTPKDNTNANKYDNNYIAQNAGQEIIKQDAEKAVTFVENKAVEVMKDAKEEFQELKKEFKPCDISGHYTT